MCVFGKGGKDTEGWAGKHFRQNKSLNTPVFLDISGRDGRAHIVKFIHCIRTLHFILNATSSH